MPYWARETFGLPEHLLWIVLWVTSPFCLLVLAINVPVQLLYILATDFLDVNPDPNVTFVLNALLTFGWTFASLNILFGKARRKWAA